ncbi:hypothetical protein [Helicobacter sp. 11S02596-1]|uniref:hypothetical protein n=1 Tax=Helicobacter sp. 11S02596-1 TaxID=1476194 RepID=UPI000BA5C897|nr:hypothetical protein [Helicobacter sp. 11S02596-1]PAF43947.1 hypothetical protein BJI48_03935 [Helicobacter sp. 11S02596-1]
MKNTLFFALLIAFFLAGCATYNVVPQNIARYDKGIEILDSAQPNSKVQLEISQNKLGGLSNPPFVFYLGAQILKGPDILLDTSNLSASQNGKNLDILTYPQILESNEDFSDVLQDFGIPTPPAPISNTNIITPLFYYGRGGFLAYNMMFSPFIISDFSSQQMMQEQRQARKIMAANYLRKTTLSVDGKAKGGFVAISPKNIKAGTMVLKVILGDEVHYFHINIEKK